MSDLTRGPIDPNIRTLFVSVMNWSCKSFQRELNVLKGEKRLIASQLVYRGWLKTEYALLGTCENLMKIACDLEVKGSIGTPPSNRNNWRRKPQSTEPKGQ